MDLPEVGNMSSTNSANPIACSAGLAVIEEINNKNFNTKSKNKWKNTSSNLLNIKINFLD